jgi:hypothetical protein
MLPPVPKQRADKRNAETPQAGVWNQGTCLQTKEQGDFHWSERDNDARRDRKQSHTPNTYRSIENEPPTRKRHHGN